MNIDIYSADDSVIRVLYFHISVQKFDILETIILKTLFGFARFQFGLGTKHKSFVVENYFRKRVTINPG